MVEHCYIFLGTPWDGWLYSNVWRCEDMAAAFCFSVVCLSYLVPFGGRVAGSYSAYISPLVGSVVRFVLFNISPLVGSLVSLVLHLKPV